MPTIFLSPSTQQNNPYVIGESEEYYMNRIADAMEPYLRSTGIRFTRNNPDETVTQAIAQSNAATTICIWRCTPTRRDRPTRDRCGASTSIIFREARRDSGRPTSSRRTSSGFIRCRIG